MTTKQLSFWSRPNSTTFMGGVIGLLVFLVVGLLPSLVYGGYAGVMLGSVVFGVPIHEHVLAQATVVLGILSGVLSVASIFVLAGAIMATGVRSLVSKASGAMEETKVPVYNK